MATARSNARTPAPKPSEPTVPGWFRPRLTLQTLTRGDGLLGMRAVPGFGPRSTMASVARVDWTYTTDAGLNWDVPAPESLIGSRPKPTELLRGAWAQRVLMERNLPAEADARDALWATGLRPLPAEALQWRSPAASEGFEHLWSLPEETHFADFWAELVPKLQAQGWSIVVRPGFAHQSVQVDAWRIVIDPATGAETSRELAEPLGARQQELTALRQPPREGSWMLSLGVDVDGEQLDLAPLLADLLKRDSRWLDARQIAAIADDAVITLRAPGGRRIEAPAAPLKAIVGAMVDLLTDPLRNEPKPGPIQLSTWDAHRIEALRASLADTQAQRAGVHGAWQLQGEAGLSQLARRLREAGTPEPIEASTLTAAGLQLQ
jgi:hypothetical protein